ncbi:Acyltransferase [Pseudobythopirellula maris]|uniref:Acyltransferase n=1 Tax=Pseudobythopirellula maris TaxID=2527991 RepID=A0A5C5ZHZ4_9BACT|nr:1-acyl-sn-glycerol-3-phosphate acyltransferase [Pseudobythopirellula maris]TWT86856.1 Acyltransferase [Pseudobythopirellula maris]
MQSIILEEPYEFVPPVESDFWCWLMRFRLKGFLRKQFGVHSHETRHADRLKASIDEGKSVILAPNHCRLSDPMVLGLLSAEIGSELFAMASWHLFKESAYQRFIIRRLGAFSVYREGNDRQAVNQAIDILVGGRRPLIIFAEGAVSRHNDLMMEMMDGPAFIARQAAKRREKEGKPGVVIHPVAIRYSYQGDAEAAVADELTRFEQAFSWQPQTHLSTVERIGQIGEALLAVNEIEYVGAARVGDRFERAQVLIEEVLERLEKKWLDGKSRPGESVVARVKALRTTILPDLIAKKVTPEERHQRWLDLAACYYVQQIDHYPRGYLQAEKNLPERIVETVERMAEDYCDRIRYRGPMHCTMVVGEAIEVSPQRDRSAVKDPAMAAAGESLQTMLDELVVERRRELFGEEG